MAYPYHKQWTKIAKLIRDRDDFQCRICGATTQAAVLHVHHIDYNPANNISTNLVTLCSRCHTGVHMEDYRPCEHHDWPAPWGDLESLDDDPVYDGLVSRK